MAVKTDDGSRARAAGAVASGVARRNERAAPSPGDTLPPTPLAALARHGRRGSHRAVHGRATHRYRDSCLPRPASGQVRGELEGARNGPGYDASRRRAHRCRVARRHYERSHRRTRRVLAQSRHAGRRRSGAGSGAHGALVRAQSSSLADQAAGSGDHPVTDRFGRQSLLTARGCRSASRANGRGAAARSGAATTRSGANLGFRGGGEPHWSSASP